MSGDFFTTYSRTKFGIKTRTQWVRLSKDLATIELAVVSETEERDLTVYDTIVE